MKKYMKIHDVNKAAFPSSQLKKEQQPQAFSSSLVHADDNPILFISGKDIKRDSHKLSVM